MTSSIHDLDIKFRCYRVFHENDQYVRRVVEMTPKELPEGDVLIQVFYSALNYKDALSCMGNKGVTRNYPHTPGIDAAGKVVAQKDSEFKVGDKLIVTGHWLGMSHHGGFSEYICVPADWCLKLPQGMTLKESMLYGTAGLTAAQCVWKIIKGG